MKKNYYEISVEEMAIVRIKEIYNEIVNGECHGEKVRYLIDSLLEMQKDNGSWSVITDEHCDSDIRVHYMYEPTYYATAALICADLCNNLCEKYNEKSAMMKGLEFATRRELAGHGFQATASMLHSLNIYKNAGLYEWTQKNPDNIFSKMIHKIIAGIRTDIASNRTISDWNIDFRKDYEKEIDDYEKAMGTYVWYACYGSNINKSRFMRYINMCTDKTPPVDDRPYVFDHSIYFAKSASSWNGGGKAFLDDSSRGKAYGRMYKIRKDQFEEIMTFEGRDYRKQLDLGLYYGIPVYSFTDIQKNTPVTTPSDEYFATILSGLLECYNDVIPENELHQYLVNAIFPENTFKVVQIIKENLHNISIKEISERSNISIANVKISVRWLVEHRVIRQDNRSISAGHLIDNEDAYFYTEEGHCSRMLVGKILEYGFVKY